MFLSFGADHDVTHFHQFSAIRLQTGSQWSAGLGQHTESKQSCQCTWVCDTLLIGRKTGQFHPRNGWCQQTKREQQSEDGAVMNERGQKIAQFCENHCKKCHRFRVLIQNFETKCTNMIYLRFVLEQKIKNYSLHCKYNIYIKGTMYIIHIQYWYLYHFYINFDT